MPRDLVGPWVGVNTTDPAREPHPPMTSAQHPPTDKPNDATPSPPTPPSHHDPLTLPPLVAYGDVDVAPGTSAIPITVWRAAGTDAAYDRSRPDALSPSIASLLIGSYTNQGDTIVSVGDDPALAGAAGAHGLTYLTVPDPHDLSSLHHTAGTAALIVLPWPPPEQPTNHARDQLLTTFQTCRRLLRRTGCTVVALAAVPAAGTYVQHSEPLISAAQNAGLSWLHHIVTITAPFTTPRVTWRAAPTDPATLRATAHITADLDLMIFALGHGHHD